MGTGTLTPSPVSRGGSFDGEGSAVSTRWLVGVLLAVVLGAGGYVLSSLEARLTAQERISAEQERMTARQEEARKVLESEVRAEMRTLQQNQQRTLRLVVLLAKRSGIEVAE